MGKWECGQVRSIFACPLVIFTCPGHIHPLAQWGKWILESLAQSQNQLAHSYLPNSKLCTMSLVHMGKWECGQVRPIFACPLVIFTCPGHIHPLAQWGKWILESLAQSQNQLARSYQLCTMSLATWASENVGKIHLCLPSGNFHLPRAYSPTCPVGQVNFRITCPITKSTCPQLSTQF